MSTGRPGGLGAGIAAAGSASVSRRPRAQFRAPATTTKTAVRKGSTSSQGSVTTASKTIVRSTPRPKELSEEEQQELKSRDLYQRYMQAQLIRLTAQRNRDKAIAAMNQKLTRLWLAHSTLQSELTEAHIESDTLAFGSDYVTSKQEEVEALEELLQVLPQATAQLCQLCTALERSQGFLEVIGADTDAGDFDMIRTACDDSKKLVESLSERMRTDPTPDMAIGLGDISKCLGEMLHCFQDCQALLQQLHHAKLRQASLEFDAEEPAIQDIVFNIPPVVHTPKLIDI